MVEWKLRDLFYGGNAMKGRTGCPTGIITPIPHMRELARGETKELSEKARFRLKVFDWYYRKPALYSLSGQADASLTCRHFGIHRPYFYRREARYDKRRLSSLENKTTRPRNPRRPCYSRELIGKVRRIRKDDPTYSAKKIRPILLRSEGGVPSVPTIGRLISRENLFFRADTKRHKKHSKSAKKAHERQRKPYNLKADAPREIIEFDMKHVYLLGEKHYAFCAIDPVDKEAVVHIASTPSSRNGKAGHGKGCGPLRERCQVC
jgi:hypothetical protein